MAVYDFSCKTCSSNFTVKCSMEERKNAKCPSCGSNDIQRVFRPIGLMGGNNNNPSPPPRSGFG